MMVINEDAIMKKVQAFAKTPEGKRRMKARISEAHTNNQKLASGDKPTTIQDMRALSNILAEDIRASLPEPIEKVGESLIVTEPYKISSGKYKVALSFDRAAVHRDSLSSMDSPNSINFPKKKDGSLYRGRTEERRQDSMDMYGAFTGGGIDNIVALFNNGHRKQSRSVFGFWRHSGTNGDSDGLWSDWVWVRSKNDREPLRFMNTAVDDFNNKYGAKYGVVASLGSDYLE